MQFCMYKYSICMVSFGKFLRGFRRCFVFSSLQHTCTKHAKKSISKAVPQLVSLSAFIFKYSLRYSIPMAYIIQEIQLGCPCLSKIGLSCSFFFPSLSWNGFPSISWAQPKQRVNLYNNPLSLVLSGFVVSPIFCYFHG